MIRPSIVPSTVPSSVAAGAIRRMLREPASTREKTSRPFVSVPNGWPQLGGWLVGSWLSKIGSYGQTRPGKSAQKIQNPITIDADHDRRRAQEQAQPLRARGARLAARRRGVGVGSAAATVLTPSPRSGSAG